MPILGLIAGLERAKIGLKTDYCFRLSTFCNRITQYTADRVYSRLQGGISMLKKKIIIAKVKRKLGFKHSTLFFPETYTEKDLNDIAKVLEKEHGLKVGNVVSIVSPPIRAIRLDLKP